MLILIQNITPRPERIAVPTTVVEETARFGVGYIFD